METTKEWTVQVLDEQSNVKFQASTTGTEKQARALLAKLEAKRWKKLFNRKKSK